MFLSNIPSLGSNILGLGLDLSQSLFELKPVRSEPKRGTILQKICYRFQSGLNNLKNCINIRMKCYMYSKNSLKIFHLATVLAAGRGCTWHGWEERNGWGGGEEEALISSNF